MAMSPPFKEIKLEESSIPSLTAIRRLWLEFCKSNNLPVLSSITVMMTISSTVYASLLKHVVTFQSNLTQEAQSKATEVDVTRDDDDVYY